MNQIGSLAINNKISLAEAFRIRNKVKEIYTNLFGRYSVSQKYWESDQTGQDRFGKTAVNLANDILFVSDVLSSLNQAINDANYKSGAQSLNLQIANTVDFIHFLDIVVSDARNVKQLDYITNQVTGEKVKITYATELDAEKWAELKKGKMDEKFILEGNLSRLNGSTKVTFDEDVLRGINEVLAIKVV